MKNTKKAIIGKKIGMTRVFGEDGKVVPVTVVECGPCVVVNIKTEETDGYDAVQLGFGDVSRKRKLLNKPHIGQFEKRSLPVKRHLSEFRNYEKNVKIGEEITVSDFKIGDKVNVSGISKGKGFQGVVKRHGFRGVGDSTHGQHNRLRAPGSMGASSYPSRVFKGMRMAGRTGGKKVKMINSQIIKIIPEQNLLIVKGSVPGFSGSYLKVERWS
jgi:large subunit ribosomal protein L3